MTRFLLETMQDITCGRETWRVVTVATSLAAGVTAVFVWLQ
jgi:hypothetical protein